MIKKGFNLFLVITIILNTGALYSEEPLVEEPLVLEGLIEEAKANNPEVLATKKRWEAALARIPQAKALDSPTIGISFEKIPKGTINLDKTMPDDRMLSISQMIPLFGKLSLKGKIALVEFQMFGSEYKNKELEIINEVKNAYYDLFMNYKEIELNQASLKFLENIAGIAEAKYAVGDMPQEEVFKIDLEIAKLSNIISNLKQENLAKQTRLNALLNREPEYKLGAPLLQEEMTFNKEIDNLYRLTIENQPELLIFSYAIERNEYSQTLAKRNYFPDLMAGIVLRGITTGAIGPWDLMLALTVPFWFWTKQKYQVEEAIANLEEAKAAYQAMKNRALSKTKELFTNIEVAKSRINLIKANLIPILEGSIESSLAGFSAGKSDSMMLLDNERMLIETKMDYYKELVDYNMNLADLERQIGTNLK